MPIQFEGQAYPMVAQDKMTPGEIDAVERVTGLTFQKIRRMGETCVCGHGVTAHQHVDSAGEQADDHSCTTCDDCGQHESDLPTRVSTAFVWVSIKRGNPTAAYSAVEGTPFTELFVADEEEAAQAADPTDSPQPEESLL